MYITRRPRSKHGGRNAHERDLPALPIRQHSHRNRRDPLPAPPPAPPGDGGSGSSGVHVRIPQNATLAAPVLGQAKSAAHSHMDGRVMLRPERDAAVGVRPPTQHFDDVEAEVEEVMAELKRLKKLNSALNQLR